MNDGTTLEELKSQIETAKWEWLKPHMERDAIIVVSGDLVLVDVAFKVVQNDTQVIEAWIAEGLIAKPDLARLQTWDAEPDKSFQMLIVQPYVLIQELAS
jgi:hypothetical protein